MSYIELLGRITIARKSVQETFMTLREEEQDEWKEFFNRYFEEVLKGKSPSPGALAHMFILGHEYRDAYGRIWEKKQS